MSDYRGPILSRRSLLGLFGVGAASLGLSACVNVSSSGSAPATGGAATRDGFRQAAMEVPQEFKDRTAILFWAPFTGTNFEALQALFDEFNRSQTDIYAVAQSQGNYNDLNQKFTAALQAREVPDLVCFPEHRWIQFWQADALVPLDRYFDANWSLDVYLQNYVGEGKAGDETFAVPFARSTPLFYYNKDRFAEAGLPETGPKSWYEYAEMAPELLKIKVGGNPLKAFAFGAEDQWFGQSQLWAWGGKFSTADKITVADGPAVEWLDWTRNFIHKDKFGYMAGEAMTDFTTGVAAAAHGSTASLTGAKKTAKFNIGTAFMLGKDTAGPKVPTGGSGLSIVKAESQDRQDACAELLRFLAQPEKSAQWHRDTGYLPIVTAAQDTTIVKQLVKEDPNYKTAFDQVRNAQTADPVSWWEGPVQEINKSMAAVYGDNADPSAQVTALAATLEESMGKYIDTIAKVNA
ncbi:ABC transporter substrate-binding protein [Corynebacterium provencense]|jgi:sn-glycerol 3-phosphate transport system substrate-binding protein|uniref:sn-glycerol-3-phosphate-binding periplasmic protein UgpB n=1 Tax=Corynebacterium provencense TaxID=1737425 RepID=A0A2Z3YM83_9CORY|nr:ABC transporter substrate-binding protein [Corynebacterium provencense]AWT24888.1 sn-glycerol-3-phosphate-binding periplasmic protein UgpB [Corynebacterium provencense]MCI1255875.1 ABC transporter substrate-binding protein [Corynebacterium provencense]